MPIYCNKLWHDGDTRDAPGNPLSDDLQELYGKPPYRPGWTVKFETNYFGEGGVEREGKIRYVFAGAPSGGRLYFVETLDKKGNAVPHDVHGNKIIERVEDKVA